MKQSNSEDYYFVVRQYDIEEGTGEHVYSKEVLGIGLYDSKLDIVYPLPITKFLESYRKKSGSLSSQRNPAEAVKRFLNYCRTKALKRDPIFINLIREGLQGLKLEHGSDYITSLSERNRNDDLDKDYVKGQIRYLNQFYRYLQKEGIVNIPLLEPKYKQMIIRKDGESKTELVYIDTDVFAHPDLGTVYPTKRRKKNSGKLKDFGKDRYLMVKEFISTAESVEPDIVIGLYFQFYGGLRIGEVVNLTRDALIESEDSFILDVDDRRDILFKGKSTTDAEQVKVLRYQGLFWDEEMHYAIERQLEWLKKLEKSKKLKVRESLLVNRRTLEPMKGANYYDKFNRVKDAYLKKLSQQGRMEHYNFLTSKEWATHIGRGVFTNFCLQLGMTIGEVAVARGDSNPNTVMDYVEEKVATQTLREAMKHINKVSGNDKRESSIDAVKQGEWRSLYD